MNEYKGYQYTIEYDEDRPIHLNWRFSIYKQSKLDLVRVHTDYAGSRSDAEKVVKNYIDMWSKSNE